MRDTSIIHIHSLMAPKCADGTGATKRTEWPAAQVNGLWIPSRPEGFASPRNRIKAAWLVFTGRADALVWGGGQ